MSRIRRILYIIHHIDWLSCIFWWNEGGAIDFLYNVVEDSQANMNNVNILTCKGCTLGGWAGGIGHCEDSCLQCVLRIQTAHQLPEIESWMTLPFDLEILETFSEAFLPLPKTTSKSWILWTLRSFHGQSQSCFRGLFNSKASKKGAPFVHQIWFR